jgi:hypothetical protein
MKKLFALIVPLLVVAAAAPGTRLLIELQETTATMQATWTYDFPQDDTISFVWWVTEEATGTEVVRDTTPDLQTEQWQHARTATDDAYLFNLEVFKIVADAWIPSGRPYVERYIIPARAPFVLVAETTETTRPDSIPDDPSQQIAEGTLWMEFTPNTTTGPQGLWSKDFNGYGTGGHLSVWMEGATVYWRIQDDSTSYQHQRTGVAAGQLNQIAVEFGPGGFKGWLNSELAFDDPYTGGLIGNDNAIVVGAMSQSFEPWTNALDGTMHTTELYDRPAAPCLRHLRERDSGSESSRVDGPGFAGGGVLAIRLASSRVPICRLPTRPAADRAADVRDLGWRREGGLLRRR